MTEQELLEKINKTELDDVVKTELIADVTLFATDINALATSKDAEIEERDKTIAELQENIQKTNTTAVKLTQKLGEMGAYDKKGKESKPSQGLTAQEIAKKLGGK